MHGSLGQFKAMRQRRQERLDANDSKFKKGKTKYSSLTGAFDFPTPTPEEAVAIRAEIRAKLKKRQRYAYLKWTILTILTLTIGYFLIYSLTV